MLGFWISMQQNEFKIKKKYEYVDILKIVAFEKM